MADQLVMTAAPAIQLEMFKVGITGPPGSPGYSYTWQTATTNADPGAGKVKVNNATLASATALYISETDAQARVLSALIARWDDSTSPIKGELTLQDPTTPANFATFSVTGALTDNGAWVTLPITLVASGGTLSNNLPLLVSFNRTGDLGATGATGSPILWPRGTFNGLTLSRASATTFSIAPGDCRNDDGGTGFNMSLASTLTKSLSAWAVGTGNGGLDTGTIAANTWYHVHEIRKTSDGSLDALCSLSPTAPTMPTGYVAHCYLNSFKTDVSSQIVAFIQVGDETSLDAAIVELDETNPGILAGSKVLAGVPTGLKVMALLDIGLYEGTSGSINAAVTSLDVSDQAPQAGATAALTGLSTQGSPASGGTCWLWVPKQVRTNTSAQIRRRLSVSGAADHFGIITRGWRRIRSQ